MPGAVRLVAATALLCAALISLPFVILTLPFLLPALVIVGTPVFLAALVFFAYYLAVVVERPRVFAKDTLFNRTLLKAMPSVSEKRFFPTPYLFGRHAQTIAGAMRRAPHIPYERVLVKTPDGGQFAMDYYHNEESAVPEHARPAVLVCAGLTGGSGENYVRSVVAAVAREGMRAVVFNNRGCADTPILTPRSYSAANTEDLALAVRELDARLPGGAPVVAIGVSLGSIILTKYLSELGARGERSRLLAAMAVSNPWDVHLASDSLERGLAYWFYNLRLTRKLQRLFRDNGAVWKGAGGDVSRKGVLRAASIREFDVELTCKQFGYATVRDYYDDASSRRVVHTVDVPLLALNAADDPFAPVEGIPTGVPDRNPNVILAVTGRGGHIGFLDRLLPFVGDTYMDRVALEFFLAVLRTTPGQHTKYFATPTAAAR